MPEHNAFTAKEAAFIAARDSFYLATVNSDGWPYIQHRGGPARFLKVLGPHQLGFPDSKGNCQLLSTGNLDGCDRVSLFLMDYPNRERLKILGHAQVLDAREHPALADQLNPTPDLREKVERVFLIEVVSFDWKCPHYVTRVFPLPKRTYRLTTSPLLPVALEWVCGPGGRIKRLSSIRYTSE